MRIIADFKCEDNHIEELWCDFNDREATCSICEKPSKRFISSLNFSLPVHSAFPTAVDKWAKGRDKKIEQERRDERNHGPDHYEHKVREV